MRGYYETDQSGRRNCYFNRNNLPEPTSSQHRTPFGMRRTLAVERERRIQYWIRAAVITVIVGLVGLYMYYA